MATLAMFGGSGDAGALLLLLIPFGGLLLFLPVLRLFALSARAAGIEEATMGKSFLTLTCGSLFGLVVIGIFSLLPVIGTFVGLFLDFFTRPLFTVVFFNTTYSRGLVTQILFLLIGAMLIGGIVTVVIVGGSAGIALV